jgi:hypothetical protein
MPPSGSYDRLFFDDYVIFNIRHTSIPYLKTLNIDSVSQAESEIEKRVAGHFVGDELIMVAGPFAG